MALYSDMNGFPESGFPVLVDVEDRLTLNTLHYSPIKHLGYKLDVVGNNRLLGALVLGGGISGATTVAMSGALSGVTSLGMNGALTGASTIGASGNVTLSGGNLLLTTGQIGSNIGLINKSWLKDLYVKNRPTCGEDDYIALTSDFSYLLSRQGRIGDEANNTTFELDGTIKFNGTATVFDDLLGDITGVKTLGTGVSINAAESNLAYTAAATTSDYAYFNYQLSHSWKLGSTVFPHIHFEQNQNAIPNWLIQYRWQIQGLAKTTLWTNAKYNTGAFIYTSGTLNQISYDGGIAAPVGAGLSDIIQIRLIRDTNNSSGLFAGVDTYTGIASVTSIDLHYEIDSIGSKTEYQK